MCLVDGDMAGAGYSPEYAVMRVERFVSFLSESSLRRQALGITQVLSSLGSIGDAVAGCSSPQFITVGSDWKHSGASRDAMQLQNRRCFSSMWPPGGSHAKQAPAGKLVQSVDVRTGGVMDVRLETGTMALQADGACLASSGSTHVLATAVCNSAAVVEDDEGMLPLQVRDLLGCPGGPYMLGTLHCHAVVVGPWD